jgi:hypothetical protein
MTECRGQSGLALALVNNLPNQSGWTGDAASSNHFNHLIARQGRQGTHIPLSHLHQSSDIRLVRHPACGDNSKLGPEFLAKLP